MTLRRRLAAVGQFLFRFRSILPLAILVGLTWLLWNTLPLQAGRWLYVWRAVACGLAAAGIVVRAATIGRVPRGTSGRNTKRQKATSLNTTGTYSVVRNPLYIGNGLQWIGATMLLEDPLLTAAFGACLFTYYLLVVYAEEEYLTDQFGEQYTAYAARTPAVIPRLGGWIPPDRPFSWRMVIRREHDSVFSVLTGLVFAVHVMEFRVRSWGIMLRREWVIPWLVAACVWMGLKVIKKRTHLLRVEREPAVPPPGPPVPVHRIRQNP